MMPQPNEAPARPVENKPESLSRLMKKMGSKSGFFDPIPPDQYKWAMAPDQPPLIRLWGWMCSHTIHGGHRNEYAVNKDRQEAHIEHAAQDLEMDEGNVRRAWREGVERGLWRNGTREEGKRKLYLCGQVPLFDIHLATQKSDCTDLFESYPPYQREAIKALAEDRRRDFLSRATKVAARAKAVLAELVAAGREVIDKEHDTLFREFDIPIIRETHKKKTATPEQIKERQERQARIATLVPTVEQFVQTFEQSEQTGENGLYEGQSTAVQTPPTLLPREPLEKELDGGRSLPIATQSSSENLPSSEERSINQQYAPTPRDTSSREARSLAQKQAQQARKQAEPKTLKPPAPDAAMVDELFRQLENMQISYPHTDFSAEHVNASNPGDRATVAQIIQAAGMDVIGFCHYVAGKFRGLDRNALGKAPARSPAHPTGPRSLGLILEWAKDYAAGGRPVQPAERAKAVKQSEYESFLKATRHAESVLADPAASEEEKEGARTILGIETARGAAS
jgi:hypothetical protein